LLLDIAGPESIISAFVVRLPSLPHHRFTLLAGILFLDAKNISRKIGFHRRLTVLVGSTKKK
jgi:hypothetical protein